MQVKFSCHFRQVAFKRNEYLVHLKRYSLLNIISISGGKVSFYAVYLINPFCNKWSERALGK